MTDGLKEYGTEKSKSKSTASSPLKYILIFLSVAALICGFVLGLQVFEVLAEFKRLGIFLIFGSAIGAVLLIAVVKILNDLSYIKSKLEEKT